MLDKNFNQSILFQVGTIGSLLQGVYKGDMSIGQLQEYGDFGLGTFDEVDGELVILDGKFYQVDGDGMVHIADDSQKTPFAIITKFQPDITFNLSDISGLTILENAIDSHIPSTNFPCAISVKGNFNKIHARSESSQPHPYRPLAETLPNLQKTFEIINSTGTLVAFRFPSYMQGINVPGYHFHYLNDEKNKGGHVFDIKTKNANVQVCILKHFAVSLIDNDLFKQANLGEIKPEDVTAVEKKRGG